MSIYAHERTSADAAPNDPSPDRTGTCVRCERMADEDQRDMRMLRRLADLGMELAQAVQGRAMEQIALGQQPTVGGDPGLVFSRIAKVVRQAIALKRKIAEEADARDHKTAEWEAARAKRAAEAERSRINQRKYRVRRDVERLIEENAEGSDQENLLADLDDRLDDYDADGDLSRGAIDTIIARLSAELGFTPDELVGDGADGDDADEDDADDGAGPDDDDPPDRRVVLPSAARPPSAGRNAHDPPKAN